MEKSFFTYRFEKLEVYQLARRYRVEIKKLCLTFPADEKFELISQIRRSSSSIATNLAEGSGRSTGNDQAYFSNIAYSSALETIDHLIYAFDMEYISEEVYSGLRVKLDEIINKLNSLYKYQINQSESLKDKLKN